MNDTPTTPMGGAAAPSPLQPEPIAWLKKVKIIALALFLLIVAGATASMMMPDKETADADDGRYAGADRDDAEDTAADGDDDAAVDADDAFNVLAYITSNTELRVADWDDAKGQTYLYRAFLDADAEPYCSEFQSEENDYEGAGASADWLSTDDGIAAYAAAAGSLADRSSDDMARLLSDGSTLAEVCVKDGLLYLTTVGPDNETVTPFEFNEDFERFYAFDPILAWDGYHQLLFDLIPGYIAFLTLSADDGNGPQWEFYALDPMSSSTDLIERCRRATEDDEAVTYCDREWRYR